MDHMLSDVHTRGSELLNNLNPLGLVSREFSLFKKFILINLAIEHITILVSCAMAVLMFGLMPTIAAFINRITLDWGIEISDKLTLLFNHSFHTKFVINIG